LKTIVFLDRATLSVDMPEFSFPHRWIEYPSTAPEQVVECCQGAQIVVSNKVALSRTALDQLPDLELRLCRDKFGGVRNSVMARSPYATSE
jgi:glycerate dehydrogenase